MKNIYYLDPNGVLHAFEENIKQALLDSLIKDRVLTKAKDAQVDALLNPKPTTEQLAAAARADRKTRFDQLDRLTVQLRWQDYTDAEKVALGKYRQALRDMPSSPGFPEKIEWPKLPIDAT